MTTASQDRIKQTVPFAVTKPDELAPQRYYDPEFYKLECEKLWPRVWQMACRLEEIPRVGNYVLYEILDQSIIVIRTAADTVKAFYNHCPHRGQALVVPERGSRPNGFLCSFHGWQWNIDGTNRFIFSPELFDDKTICSKTAGMRAVKCETWAGCAFINLDDNAPPLRDSLGTFGAQMDAMQVQDMRVEWWHAAKLPCNWKLAMEAFQEGYHVMATHPQLIPDGASAGPGSIYAKVPEDHVTVTRYFTAPSRPMPTEVASEQFIAAYVKYMRVLGRGMGNALDCEKDIATAEKLHGTKLPAKVLEADTAFRRKLNDAVMAEHKAADIPIPDLNQVDKDGLAITVNFLFPHYFLLPTYSSAASYRVRPLGPEECLFEVWSLQRYPKDEQRPPLQRPTPMSWDDPRWPQIPAQDFSNLPFEQTGLHSKGLDVLRLSNKCEGMISNNHRLIDGYLAGLGYEQLTPAAKQVSGGIDCPIRDLGF